VTSGKIFTHEKSRPSSIQQFLKRCRIEFPPSSDPSVCCSFEEMGSESIFSELMAFYANPVDSKPLRRQDHPEVCTVHAHRVLGRECETAAFTSKSEHDQNPDRKSMTAFFQLAIAPGVCSMLASSVSMSACLIVMRVHNKMAGASCGGTCRGS
jgi:hypothetical protein